MAGTGITGPASPECSSPRAYSRPGTESKPLLEGFEQRFLEVRAARIRYFVGGIDGPPVVLVHGFAGAASNFVLLAPLLARRHRVLVPDLPGHGGSDPLPAVPGLAPFADRVAALVEHERLGGATVAGHSMGGLVALRLAIRRPELAAGVVLLAAAGISTTGRTAGAFLASVTALQPGRRIARFRRRIARSPRLKALVFGPMSASDGAALPDPAVLGFFEGSRSYTDIAGAGRALAREDVRPELELVRCPALVLAGARDRQVPVDDAFEYARRLGAPLRVIADCGHLPLGERPEACADAIERFIAV